MTSNPTVAIHVLQAACIAYTIFCVWFLFRIVGHESDPCVPRINIRQAADE